jgi:hypothetical protein
VTVTIYHNPDCGSSRNVLALIRNAGEEPTVIEYLKTPPMWRAASSTSSSVVKRPMLNRIPRPARRGSRQPK